MADQIEIDVWQGEIADLEVDGIVLPANESLFMTSALAAAVKRRAGIRVEQAAVAQGPIRAGNAVVTEGGDLAAPYLIHAVAVGHDRLADPTRLAAATAAALTAADALGLRTLAVANLGSGQGVFAPADSAAIIVAEILRHAEAGSNIESIVLTVASAAERSSVLTALRASAEAR
ncbi:MAG TPA: macro domain-containing protein [Candidatus Limnocylindria bacterium]|nr:macro domain-containing protein [Candidatus Limnocylindria bacterium]